MISINYKDCSLMGLHQIDVAVHIFSPIFITWFCYFFTLLYSNSIYYHHRSKIQLLAIEYRFLKSKHFIVSYILIYTMK